MGTPHASWYELFCCYLKEHERNHLDDQTCADRASCNPLNVLLKFSSPRICVVLLWLFMQPAGPPGIIGTSMSIQGQMVALRATWQADLLHNLIEQQWYWPYAAQCKRVRPRRLVSYIPFGLWSWDVLNNCHYIILHDSSKVIVKWHLTVKSRLWTVCLQVCPPSNRMILRYSHFISQHATCPSTYNNKTFICLQFLHYWFLWFIISTLSHSLPLRVLLLHYVNALVACDLKHI